MKRYCYILSLIFSLFFLWGCLEDPEVYKVTVKTNNTVEFVQGGVSVNGGIYTENEKYLPTIDSCGFCYGTNESPTISNYVYKVKNPAVGDINGILKQLNDNTKYYVRAFAQNKYGIMYGEEVSFVSLTKPIVKTLSLLEDKENSQLIVECELESLGSGDITELGVCYSSVNKLPSRNNTYKLTTSTQKGKYTVSIPVEDNTKYYARAFATNLAGIVYGDVKETLSYTVKFNGNGGSGTMKDIVVIPSEYIKLSNNSFTRPGYFFVGWNTDADGSGISYSYNQSIKIEKDIILYAQWEVVGEATGSVGGHDFVDLGLPSGIKWATMNVGAESPEHSGNCYAWGEITAKSMNSWENYKWCDGSYNTLTKYCTSSSYGIVDNMETLERLDDVASVNWGSDWRMPTWDELDELLNTSYVTWTLCTLNGNEGYKITSKTNGNSIFMLACSSCGYWTSSLCTNYTDKAYYLEFYHNLNVNWSRYSRCYNLYVRAVTNVSNTDTESVQPSIYNIKFNCNSGEGNMPSKTVSVGNSFSLPENTFTRSGYEFVGWNTSSDGSGNSYTDSQTITPSGDITLYAQWKKIEYTITFDSNGGNGSMSSETVSAGNSIYLPSNIFIRTGYDFVGWNTKSDGLGTSYADSQTLTPSGDITLYAQWEKIEYTITFDSNGGSGSMSSIYVETTSSITLPTNTFTKVGYVFIGWNTSPSGYGVSYNDKQRITPSSSICLYAQWEEAYTITFDSNGGKGNMPSIDVEVGTSITLPTNTFTKKGYVFIGWSTIYGGYGIRYYNEQSIKLSGNTTLYAMWEEEVDSVIFYSVSSSYWRHSMLQLDYTIDGTVQLKYPANINIYEVGFYASWTSEGLENIDKLDTYKNQYGVKNVKVVCSLDDVVYRRYSGTYNYSQIYADNIYDVIRPYVITSNGTFYGDIIYANKR